MRNKKSALEAAHNKDGLSYERRTAWREVTLFFFCRVVDRFQNNTFGQKNRRARLSLTPLLWNTQIKVKIAEIFTVDNDFRWENLAPIPLSGSRGLFL